MKRLLFSSCLSLVVAACGSSSPTTPTPTPVATTRIITVSGDLAFGNVNIGDSLTRTFTIANSGTAALTYTGFTASGGTGSVGFTASPLTAVVQPGGSQVVTMRFAPTVAQFYSAVLTVTGDQTAGLAAINVSGIGINNAPIFAVSGKGDNVFNIPASVARVHVTGHFVDNGSTSNFIVSFNGRSFINEILRTTDYDGVLLTTGGGIIAITSSAAIAWTFTEVR